jgi:phosphate starvation-inducible PhoH-like protein
LIQALKILKGIKNIGNIYFDKKDIVRHRLVRDIVEAYDKHDEEKIEIKTETKEKNEQ